MVKIRTVLLLPSINKWHDNIDLRLQLRACTYYLNLRNHKKSKDFSATKRAASRINPTPTHNHALDYTSGILTHYYQRAD